MRISFLKGALIEYASPWEEKKHIGLITKKASAGYWVLWCDGTLAILQRSLLKYAREV